MCYTKFVADPGPTVKDCCVGTNDGQSYYSCSSGVCMENHHKADGVEQDRTFQFTVKGTVILATLSLRSVILADLISSDVYIYVITIIMQQ